MAKIIRSSKRVGVLAINGLHAFPPVKEYTNEEFRTFYEAERIDGVIRSEIKRRTAYDGMMRTEIELPLDVRSKSNAAVFYGYGLSGVGDPGRGIAKFFEGMLRELTSHFNRE